MTAGANAIPGRSNVWRTVLWGGLIAGALDIAAAFFVDGLNGAVPLRILQSIASGLLGPASYDGGLATAAVGGLLHFLIMFVICAVYLAASRKLTFLTRQAVLSGVLYGIAVYLVMNFVVLPLSAFPHPVTQPLAEHLTGLIIQIVCVGLPIALVVKRNAPARYLTPRPCRRDRSLQCDGDPCRSSRRTH